MPNMGWSDSRFRTRSRPIQSVNMCTEPSKAAPQLFESRSRAAGSRNGNQKCAAARLRVSRLDNRHPAFRRLFQTRSFPANTRLIRSHLPWLEGIEQTDFLIYPPWQAEDPRTSQNICPIRHRAGMAFEQWADTCPPLSMFLFTDGSHLSKSDAVAGAGWYGHWGAWK